MVNYALVVLVNAQHEVLLLRYQQNAPFGGGQYALVGGKIEAGETARAAAIREAYEEVGVTIKPEDVQLGHTFHRHGTEGAFFALLFVTTVWQGEPFCKEPNKHAAMGWFALDKLPENILPAHRQALTLMAKGVAYSEHGW